MRTPMGGPQRDAGVAVAALYEVHYRSLVRLAALLVSNQATAEDIVQDSFAAVHDVWPTLPDTDAALCYLRRSVIHRCRSAERVRLGADVIPGLPQCPAVVAALQALPAPQREVLVLLYFTGLSEAEIASVTGMHASAVRGQAALAMASVQAELRLAGDLTRQMPANRHRRTHPRRSQGGEFHGA